MRTLERSRKSLNAKKGISTRQRLFGVQYYALFVRCFVLTSLTKSSYQSQGEGPRLRPRTPLYSGQSEGILPPNLLFSPLYSILPTTSKTLLRKGANPRKERNYRRGRETKVVCCACVFACICLAIFLSTRGTGGYRYLQQTEITE